jgi:hypothetical protein
VFHASKLARTISTFSFDIARHYPAPDNRGQAARTHPLWRRSEYGALVQLARFDSGRRFQRGEIRMQKLHGKWLIAAAELLPRPVPDIQ